MDIARKIINETKVLAKNWQEEISQSIESDEKKLHAMMQKMLQNPKNKVFLIELLDQSFRSNDPMRVANQLEFILQKYQGTDIFTAFESFLLLLFKYAGVYIPAVSVPLFIQYLRNDISSIVIKGEENVLNKHLQMRRKQGTRVNINIIGEAVLGEQEAQLRIEKYKQILANPFIDYISIKISTIFSQISPVAHRWSIEELKIRLRLIYKAAMQNNFIDHDGLEKHKFVNLDMEEYRDVHLTLDAFKETLMEEEFFSFHAGIVLQSYLPDSYAILQELSQWAKKRVESGGAPIKVRLVKGANQEMELTEASLRNWECVTYLEKADSDANYKIMMHYLLKPEIAPYVHVGIASHNLFDHAMALLLAQENGVQKYYSAEMLEGMSEAAYKLFKRQGMNVILYAPTATAQTFTNAIAYLVRRFDENTAEENFLRHSFGLRVDTLAWDTLVQSYDKAMEHLQTISLKPKRVQNRLTGVQSTSFERDQLFVNESDTDFSLKSNQEWAQNIANKWKNIAKSGGFHAVPVIAAQEVAMSESIIVYDKSQYHEGVEVGQYCNANKDQILQALEIAHNDPDGWRQTSLDVRTAILKNVADEVRKKRADLIGIAAAEVGKVFSETDVEVSEAIDFLNFYPLSIQKIQSLEGVCVKAKGVGLVVSPWNFPIAIPAGGMAASLAAGNTVIIKPSSESVLCAYALCKCFWDGGVSKNTLQFVPVSGKTAGEMLIPSKIIDFVIFTGSEATAYEMLQIRPDLHLSAETGGKDATIVTAMADQDQAIKNVIASAFNNSGQKCSATSLLVLERELYESDSFKKTLRDAANSLHVGSVWDLHNRIGPLVTIPSGNLEKSLVYLDATERWELAPSFAQQNNPYMLKPSIRYGTKKGDFCHMNELFGPVLSVMCAENLDDAIDIVNATGYGLTSGLESLDEREQEHWKQKLKAGNLYINRGTTGAIVLRQPFGGMGKSAIGSGKKAGGFNYASQFMNISVDSNVVLEKASHPFLDVLNFAKNDLDDASLSWLQNIVGNCAYWYEKEFSQEHDYFHLRGESNHIRYLHLETILVRASKNSDLMEVAAFAIAAKIAKCSVVLSHDNLELPRWFEIILDQVLDQDDVLKVQNEDDLLIDLQHVDRIRCFGDLLSSEIYDKANSLGIYVATESFVAHGRIEMMHCFIEQSVTNSYHRYGNLGLHGLVKEHQ